MANATTAVIVTYNPQAEELEALLASLRPQVSRAVIVDNGSENVQEIRALARKHSSALIPLPNNVGIAAAQNRGILYAMNRGADFVLLSDQDSVAAPDMVEKLLECFISESADTTKNPVATVGPVPVDTRGTKEDALVYSFTTWGAKRRAIPQCSEVLEVPFVLASGCLIPTGALRDIGPLNESLFIDHVDFAWCMRAISRGYRVLVCGSAQLVHELGEESLRLPGGREVHVQSTARNYYMVRNTLYLLRAPFIPCKWKIGYLVYITKYIAFYTLAGIKHPERLVAMGKGFVDGLIGKNFR